MRSLMAAMAASAAISLGMLATSTTDATAYERWLDVHNHSSYYICEVYINNVGRSGWGRDLLGNDCLEPGYQIRVDPGYQDGYCMMDLMFVWEDGDEVFDTIDICTETDYHLYD